MEFEPQPQDQPIAETPIKSPEEALKEAQRIDAELQSLEDRWRRNEDHIDKLRRESRGRPDGPYEMIAEDEKSRIFDEEKQLHKRIDVLQIRDQWKKVNAERLAKEKAEKEPKSLLDRVKDKFRRE